MTMDKPADWAMAKAEQLISSETLVPHWRYAFARYIEAHETPPVDPLLQEAREAAAEHYSRSNCTQSEVDSIRNGNADHVGSVQSALIALQNRDNINSAARLAKRFLDCVADYNANAPAFSFSGTKESGALRRASMDLTRALASMRKP